MNRTTLHALAAAAALLLLAPSAMLHAAAPQKPNIIFILSDDVAQGDLGCYGQKLIQTPIIDRMAREGLRCTQAYCGTTVCAPSRASLMTGLHSGHSPIRANREIGAEGQMPLPAGTFTVAQLLQGAGYRTACIGKWGLGMFDTTGSPLKLGFDHFFGYNCQRHAHSYFPKFLYNDDRRFDLPGNDGNEKIEGKGAIYSQDLIADETLKFVKANRDRPFFLYYSVTLPHGAFQINDQGLYKTGHETEEQKNYAAMVSRLDTDVGRLLALLKELNLDEKTLVLFSGDNGSSFAPDSPLGKRFEQAANGLRGYKRELYEGGLRNAGIVRWPGVVPAGRVSDEPWAFWDFLPTCAELAGATIPAGVHIDGLSLVSYLKGGPAPQREYFYWELHEGASLQAVRWDDWKAVRNGPSKPIEIYDLKADAAESKNLAEEKPELVAKAAALMKSAHTDDPNWPMRDRKPGRVKKVVLNAAEVNTLRCEYRTNPLGIDVRCPRLSWVIQSDRRGEIQTAYQVLVASSPDLLRQDQGDLWDSGRVASDRSAQIEYLGKPLASHQPAYWKVKVWDAMGGMAVSREPASWSMGFSSPAGWKAKWIGRDDARSSGPGNGKEKFLPATYLRKEFTLKKIPQRAILYSTSLGVAEPHLNGGKVGEDYLSPGWTDFNQRVYYRAYDVTAQLKAGANVLGAILGDGWYRGHLSIIGQNIYGKQTRLLVQLHLFFADGSSQVIASDESWKATFGPVLEADIYAGETYDARREIPGWDEPGMSDADWKPVELGTPSNPTLQANPGAPVQRTGEIVAVAVTRPKPGIAVYDYGRNFSGWTRLKITAPSGTKIVMRFGEMLNPDGTVYRKNLRAARATDTYICKGVGAETWEPRFTYHGFQYVEVDGLPDAAGAETLTGIIAGSALPLIGNFACSDAIMTRTAANQRCTIRANLVELPTDCPQRDERMGWMDYHEVVASTLYEQDAATLLTKWMADIVDARLPDGAFSMIAPDVHHFPWSPGWADSGVLIPWTMYFVYGDTRLAARYYHEIAGHLQTYQMQSKGFVVRPVGLGDWLAPDMSTPKDLIGTALYARCAEVMAEMARALGKAQDAAAYADLHRSVRGAFQKTFLHPDGTIGSDSQGGYVLAIAYDLLEPEQARQAAEKLIAAIEKRDGHLSTGMVTTHLLLPALSKAGRTDVAYRLLAKTTFPSWGYFLQMGAKSMWERWDAKTEKGFHPHGMNSFNHANLGTCTEWFYRNVLGIDAAEPGFGKLLLKPEPGGNLSWARGYYDSQHGRIGSDWKIENGQFVWNVRIPANTTATVRVPAQQPASITEGGKLLAEVADLKVLSREASAVVVKIGSGNYEFRSRW